MESDEVSSPLPTRGAEAGPRMALSSRTVMLGVAVAGVAGVLVATLRYGIGLTPDSVTYINGARSLSAGAGYTANGHAITDFPPGYSWVLSLGEHAGIDPRDVARGLSVAALVATIVLGYVVLCRHVRSERVRAVATVSIGCSAVLLEIYEKALSEHLFLPVLLSFVMVAEEVLTRPRIRVLVVAGIVALTSSDGWSAGEARSLLPLAALVVIYVVYLVGSASVVAFAAINTRLLVPVFVPVVVLAAWLYERLRAVIRRESVRRA